MPNRLKAVFPDKPKSSNASKSYKILCSTHDTSNAFLVIFNSLREGSRGTSTDQEQDLLRAMLLFASSGLDAMVKQLVRDALPSIIEIDKDARTIFLQKMERKIESEKLNPRLFLEAIISTAPKDKIIQAMVDDLTSNSLQSGEELLKVAAFFNVKSEVITKDITGLKEIFKTRNQISHEMDVDFTQMGKKRRQRSRDVMVAYTCELLRIGKLLLREIDSRLQAKKLASA